MRLIDADALPHSWQPDCNGSAWFVSGDDIEHAPTVCCAKCAHYLPWSDKKSGECAQRHMESEHYPTPTFGCVDFERRAS